MARRLRILIADDSSLTRVGIRATLEGADFEVCAEADSAETAVEAARRERPDVCLLDIDMPGSGIRAAAEIAHELPETAILMLTVVPDDASLFEALRVGARGYLLKGTRPARLTEAVSALSRGEAVLSGELAARVIEELRQRGRGRRRLFKGPEEIELTAREWDVLDLLRQGLTTKAVADRLHLTPATVRNHVSSVVRKLKVESRKEALQIVADHVQGQRSP